MLFPTLSESSRLRYTTFFYLYFMQGVPSGFALTALVNYLIAKGITPSVIGSFSSIIGIPWIVQLIWGPLIDRYRYSVVGHYKHWIVLTQVAAFCASLLLLLVHDPVAEIWFLAGLFFTHSLVASVQDASVDAMAILITPKGERGRVNGFMRGGILLGISFGAAVLSIVLNQLGFHAAVIIQSAILLLFTVLFFFTKLHRTDPLLPKFGSANNEQTLATGPTLPTLFRQLKAAVFGERSLRIFGIIFLSYLSFSIFIRSANFYMIRTLKWSDQDLSVLSGGWGSIVTLLVVLGGGWLADKVGITKLQRIVLITLAVFLIGFNLMSDWWTYKPMAAGGLLFWNIADPLYSIAAFPILMAICSKHVAGSQFTAYMALINLSDIGGGFFTGLLLERMPGPVLGLIAGVMLAVLAIGLFRFQRAFLPEAETYKVLKPL